jgi:5-methylcytosine-specific restriction protein A
MAMAPPRPCSDPTCPTLNCTEHLVEAWRTRARPVVQRVRGRALQRMRARLYATHPWCAVCRRRLLTLREMVRDHTIPLFEGGRDDETNEQALCVSCSKTKTESESKRGRARS